MEGTGLIVVDVQNDFCPGGALPVAKGDEIIPKLNAVIQSFEHRGLPVFFTRDWHPKDHCSFVSQGGIWPAHCVKGSRGARFHPDLFVPTEAHVISKATRRNFEAYSAFQGTTLERRLRDLGVRRLVVGGLATDYCVKNTVLDGLAAGFGVDLMTDCVKGVNLKKNDSAAAIREMVTRGAELTSVAAVIDSLSPTLEC